MEVPILKRVAAAAMVCLVFCSLSMPAGVALAVENTPSAGSQTGSGQMELSMILSSPDEHGGTAVDTSNPDDNHDGLGDNLAFTVPSAVNYVVKPDGRLIGPSEGAVYIENRSVFPTHVTAMDVDPEAGINFVADASASSVANSVDLQIGTADDILDASDYLTKGDVTDSTKWEMGTDAGVSSEGYVNAITSYDSDDIGYIDLSEEDSRTLYSLFDRFVMIGGAQNFNAVTDFVEQMGLYNKVGDQYVPIEIESVDSGFSFVDVNESFRIHVMENYSTQTANLAVYEGDIYRFQQTFGRQLPLLTAGHVSNIDKDITSLTRFGTVKWYVAPTVAPAPKHSITLSWGADAYLTVDKNEASAGETVTISAIPQTACSYTVYQTGNESNVILQGDTWSVPVNTFIMPDYDVTIYYPFGSGN